MRRTGDEGVGAIDQPATDRFRAPPGRRAWSNAFIAAVLLYEVAMPLRYYLGVRGPDERFAWRMFSTLFLQRCRVRVAEEVEEGGVRHRREVDLEREIQATWIGMLEHGLPRVVEKFLRWRCEMAGTRQVRLFRSCTDVHRRALPTSELRMDCARGELHGAAP